MKTGTPLFCSSPSPPPVHCAPDFTLRPNPEARQYGDRFVAAGPPSMAADVGAIRGGLGRHP